MTGTIAPIGIGTVIAYPKQTTAGMPLDPLVDPGDTNPPILFEPPPGLTAGDTEVWIIATGGANWGGCQIWLSLDGTTYAYAGTIYRGGRPNLDHPAEPRRSRHHQPRGRPLQARSNCCPAPPPTPTPSSPSLCDGELLAYATAT
jgi:hypothetical protein